ncbi:hypothetical protein C8Q75DRAFT_731388 [Abortiporus biennis]|nr:hypothetical protein C8Q75DRAFT_731388 [Abortiporus biennis]
MAVWLDTVAPFEEEEDEDETKQETKEEDNPVDDDNESNFEEENLFPYLKTLVLRHIDVDSLSSGTTGKDLLDVLTFRSDHNLPIEKLLIESEIEVPEECLREYRKVVREVEYREIPEKIFEPEPEWLIQMRAFEKRHTNPLIQKVRAMEEDVDDTVASLWSPDEDDDDNDFHNPLFQTW